MARNRLVLFANKFLPKHKKLDDSSDASVFAKAKSGDRQALYNLASNFINFQREYKDEAMKKEVCDLLFKRAKTEQDSKAAALLLPLDASLYRDLEESPPPNTPNTPEPESAASFYENVSPLSSEPTDEEKTVLAKTKAAKADESYKSPPAEKGRPERTASPTRISGSRLKLSFQTPLQAKTPAENPEKKVCPKPHQRSNSLA